MMKKNNTKKNRTARKLLPAAGMLAVSASMLATSTYAWFTMNKEVQVTGLAMKTKVGSNLLISSNNAEGSYNSDTLVEGRKALLEPVSTITGKTGSFYYTLDAAENGSKVHDKTATGYGYSEYNESTGLASPDSLSGKYKYDSTFNTAYGNGGSAGQTTEFKTAYGYVDYIFYLKATGDAAGQQLRMTQCDLNYTYPEGFAATGDNAWRVAVFASDITANGGKGNVGDGYAVGTLDPAASDPVTILKLEEGVNWTANTAVSGETTTGTVKNHDEAAVLDDNIGAGVTKYYKVLVRVWLEGEDKSCNSATYAKLTDQWTLDLDFQLTNSDEAGTGKTAVTQISHNDWAPNVVTTQNAASTPVEVVTTAAAAGGGGNG